jgi:hypothetical protein
MTTSTTTPRTFSTRFHRVAYTLMVLLGCYFFFFSADTTMGAANMGIALIFDPFDQQVPFGKRPVWQRVWLVVHLLVMATMAVLAFWK